MKRYEIGYKTVALINQGAFTQVIEDEQQFDISIATLQIIKESCSYYGSSFEGRVKGSSSSLGLTYKVPILVMEDCVFFPTRSSRDKACSWIGLNHLERYIKKGDSVEVLFANGIHLILPVTYGVFHKQVLHATRLKYIYQKRLENR